jgi:hypothetical protein
MFKNLGFVLFGLAALVIVIILILLMRLLINKFPIIKKVYIMLS